MCQKKVTGLENLKTDLCCIQKCQSTSISRFNKNKWWRRRESNPRPRYLLLKRLHVQLVIRVLRVQLLTNGLDTPINLFNLTFDPVTRSLASPLFCRLLPQWTSGRQTLLSIKQQVRARQSLQLVCLNGFFKRPTDQPLHAAYVFNIQSKPLRPPQFSLREDSGKVPQFSGFASGIPMIFDVRQLFL